MINKTDIHAVYIDESLEELSYARRLTRVGLTCRAFAPKRTVDETLELLRELTLDDEVDVVLLDYRLDDRPEDRIEEVNYRGGTVAAALREQLPQVPLVLVTTAEKFEQSLEHNTLVQRLFDLMILKEELLTSLEQRKSVANKIRDLALGYQLISRQTQQPTDEQTIEDWEAVAVVMAATSVEREDLAASHSGKAPFGTIEVAEWMLRRVLEFPGFLLDSRETAVRLGITQDSFDLSEIQEWLQPSRYSGAFSKLKRRWWRGRIEELLRDVAGPDSIGESGRRVEAIASSTGVQGLQVDRCVWCGSELISRACYLCRRAVDPSHQLVGNVDERPGWAEPAVVCFRCIADGSADDIRFGVGAEDIVHGLRTGEIQPPDAR